MFEHRHYLGRSEHSFHGDIMEITLEEKFVRLQPQEVFSSGDKTKVSLFNLIIV